MVAVITIIYLYKRKQVQHDRINQVHIDAPQKLSSVLADNENTEHHNSVSSVDNSDRVLVGAKSLQVLENTP